MLVAVGFMQVYVEPVYPDPTLYIFGAGFVSKAVAGVAKPVGFRIVVVDIAPKAPIVELKNADDFYVDSWEKVFEQIAGQ